MSHGRAARRRHAREKEENARRAAETAALYVPGPYTPGKVAEMLRVFSADPRLQACLLCRGPGAFFGVFFPYHPELYTNVPLRPGKERRLVYALCEECYARPDKVERVEAHILAAANAELPEQ